MRTLVAIVVAIVIATPALGGIKIKHDFYVTCVEQLPKPFKGTCWYPAPLFEKPGPYHVSEYRLLNCRRYSFELFKKALKPFYLPNGREMNRYTPDDFPPHKWPDTNPAICRAQTHQ